MTGGGNPSRKETRKVGLHLLGDQTHPPNNTKQENKLPNFLTYQYRAYLKEMTFSLQ